MKIKAILAYDGSRFNGFQIQNSGVDTVANRIQSALERLGIDPRFNASGRTDRGVHARGQVIDFCLNEYWSDLGKLKVMLNRHLPDAIRIRSLSFVDENFHARFSAKRRRYAYVVSLRTPTPFGAPYLYYYDKQFDMDLLNRASSLFIGKKDFRAFMKSGSDTQTSVRTIYHAKWYRYGQKRIFIVEADGFLRSQIRMTVATLLAVNEGYVTLEALADQIALRSVSMRRLAPGNGLYLTHITY